MHYPHLYISNMKQRHCQVWGGTIFVVEPKPEITSSECLSCNLSFQSLFQCVEKNQHSVWMKLSTDNHSSLPKHLRYLLRWRASANFAKWCFFHVKTLYLPVILSSWTRVSPQRVKGGRRSWEDCGWWVLDRGSSYWRDEKPIKSTSA